MGTAVKISVGVDEFERLIQHLRADMPTIKKAMNRAIRETLRFARNRLKKELRGQLPANVIKARILQKFGRGKGSVFFGLNPVGAELFHKNLKPVPGGMRAGSAFYPDTFLIKGKAYQRKGRKRLPIVRQRVEFMDEGEAAVEAVYRELEEKFYQRFEHHLYFFTGAA